MKTILLIIAAWVLVDIVFVVWWARLNSRDIQNSQDRQKENLSSRYWN